MDKFVRCPPEALVWEQRRWRLLEEHQDVAIAHLRQKSIFFFFSQENAMKKFGWIYCLRSQNRRLCHYKVFGRSNKKKGFVAISGALS
jgi:hypothetical protein